MRSLIDILKKNNELVDEYIYSKGIHVVEVRPDIDYTAFLEGRYSEIYTQEQFKKCFNGKGPTSRIIMKDPNYFNEYYKFIVKQFGHVTESSVKEHKEYDMLPCLNQEIMSYE